MICSSAAKVSQLDEETFPASAGLEAPQVNPGGEQVGETSLLSALRTQNDLNPGHGEINKTVLCLICSGLSIIGFRSNNKDTIYYVASPRLELCVKKGVYYIIEQPVSSLLFQYRPVKRLLRKHGARVVKCMLGAFGAPTLKPVA